MKRLDSTPSSSRRRLLAAATVCLLPSIASAHHSFAIFDKTRIETVKGTVARFDWTNPHVTIYVDVPGPSVRRFKIESGSVNALARHGWRSDAIKVGDQAEVSFHPLSNGAPGGLLIEIRIDGVVLSDAG